MRLTGMIWDLDGTLADTLPMCIVAFRHVFAAHLGRRYSDEEIAALFGASEEGMIRQVMPDHWREGEQAYLIEYERLHDSYVPHPFPGIFKVLDTLQERHIRLAIVTGKGRGSADISLRRLGLAPYFEYVEVGSPDGPIKPSGMRTILNAWHMDPQNCAYIGDTTYDMVAAAEVGLIGLGAAWSTMATVTATDTPAPAATFTHVDGLLTWIAHTIEP